MNKDNNIVSNVRFPFDRIIPYCKDVMASHSKKKGNSWQDCDHMFLRGKLVEEFAEVVLNPNDPRELADLINIASMLLYRYVPEQYKEKSIGDNQE